MNRSGIEHVNAQVKRFRAIQVKYNKAVKFFNCYLQLVLLLVSIHNGYIRNGFGTKQYLNIKCKTSATHKVIKAKDQALNAKPVIKLGYKKTLCAKPVIKLNYQALHTKPVIKLNYQTLGAKPIIKLNNQTLGAKSVIKLSNQTFGAKPVTKFSDPTLGAKVVIKLAYLN